MLAASIVPAQMRVEEPLAGDERAAPAIARPCANLRRRRGRGPRDIFPILRIRQTSSE